jgi:HJR/Mrr/RecB family endonuclease
MNRNKAKSIISKKTCPRCGGKLDVKKKGIFSNKYFIICSSCSAKWGNISLLNKELLDMERKRIRKERQELEKIYGYDKEMHAHIHDSEDYILIQNFIKNNIYGNYDGIEYNKLHELFIYKGYNINEKTFSTIISYEAYKQLKILINEKISYNNPKNLDDMILNYINIRPAFTFYSEETLLNILSSTINEKYNINLDENSLKIKISDITKELQFKRFEEQLRDGSYKIITIEKIDSMDGIEFENFLEDLFSKRGYSVYNNKYSRDQGADLILTNIDSKIVVQAKNYAGYISNSAVQQVVAAKGFYNADEGWIVTNSYLTPSAKELAYANQIRIINRDSLTKLIQKHF